MSLTTKALGKAERMCKRPQSHCLLQQRLNYKHKWIGLVKTLRKKSCWWAHEAVLSENRTKENTSGANPLTTNQINLSRSHFKRLE